MAYGNFGTIDVVNLTVFGHLNLIKNIYNITLACTLREISKGAEFTWVKTMETSLYKWEPMELK
jgi:hypothetical protein